MNIVDLNLDMISLLKGLQDDCAVFYFLTGPNEGEDLLYAKGNLDDMAEALCNLMEQHEDIEYVVKSALMEFQS
jgi:hypothetical protein